MSSELSQSSCWWQDGFVCLHVRRGSAIAKIVGANAAKYDKFDTTVNMWVFEEVVNGRKLTEIINTDHENVKYLPGHKLPPNVVRPQNSLWWSNHALYFLCLAVPCDQYVSP